MRDPWRFGAYVAAVVFVLAALAFCLDPILGQEVESAVVPVCGQNPKDAPPSTAEYCETLPPAGFHAGVAWQTDEFNPGYEEAVVDLLHLESYYNWQPYPRSVHEIASREWWDLSVKHVPMLYDPLDPDANCQDPMIFCFIPTQCEHMFIWNEPDAYNQAWATPAEVAYFNYRLKRQQANLCYNDLHSNWSGVGTLLVNFDEPDQAYDYYVAEYLEADGPIPDAWHMHMYADTWEQLYELWEMLEFTFELFPFLERPVILSEVACTNPDIEERKRCMTNLAELVEINDRLHSAYWFVGEGWDRYDEDFTLVSSELRLTELGRHFNAVRGHVPNQFIGVVLVRLLDFTRPPEPEECYDIPVIPPPACYNGAPAPPSFCPCYEG